jgi:hypothetical protein
MKQKFPSGQPGAGERKLPAGVLTTLSTKHANAVTQCSGSVHMPIGGGVVASGTKFFVIKESVTASGAGVAGLTMS